ncbi:MAG: glucans biosynthesis glucosyltransferase MdoH [Candidatus Deferrimicrobium sp.]
MGQPETDHGPSPANALPTDRVLHDWRGAYGRAVQYLEALGVEATRRPRLALRAVEAAFHAPSWEGGEAFAETQKQLRRLVMERYPTRHPASGDPEDRFEAWRLEAAFAGRSPRDIPAGNPSPWRAASICSTPPLSRQSMGATKFEEGLFRRGIVRTSKAYAGAGWGAPGEGDAASGPHIVAAHRRKTAWARAAWHRRILLPLLTLFPDLVASQFMLETLPYQGGNWLEVAIVLFFAALFGWISIGFWTAVAGFFVLLRGRDRFAIAPDPGTKPGDLDPTVRTAIVMPICDEPIERVFTGLKIIFRSLERSGAGRSFDFFVLSDSADLSNQIREEEEWFDWARRANGFGRIFYRHRRDRVKRKSGNIADFCRRWGRNYRYMIVLDADSIMTGEAIVRLVHLMETHPDAGIIQTFPIAVDRRSLFGRLQQFARRIYGPLFAAGLHYWLLGDGQYWGHNAILRVAPFMEHCSLPRLPGDPPLGGEILSHDFVESALLGKAGWTVWLAYDLPGSYEETPASLLEEMGRDRRWCQGNLQHLQLVFTQGLRGAHRALFFHGALSYGSAFLWLGFLLLCTAEAVGEAVFGPRYFPSGPSLFPQWPIWRPDWALTLAALTAAILFLPKILGVALVCLRGTVRSYGGVIRFAASVLFEIVLSALLAPIRMMFHARFVVLTFIGSAVSWGPQARKDAETRWEEAIRHHGLDTLVATVWGLGMYALNPSYFWWLTPIVGALILSVPLSVFASRLRIGELARALGIFLTPEETSPRKELEEFRRELGLATAAGRGPVAVHDGFVRAIVDPYANALHCMLLGRTRKLPPSIRDRREAARGRALREGPEALSASERGALVHDREGARALHREVWCLRPGDSARRWIPSGG